MISDPRRLLPGISLSVEETAHYFILELREAIRTFRRERTVLNQTLVYEVLLRMQLCGMAPILKGRHSCVGVTIIDTERRIARRSLAINSTLTNNGVSAINSQSQSSKQEVTNATR